MNNICAAEPCPVILNSTCVFYRGANLVYTGILTNDNFQTVLEKIDNKFKNAAIGYVFNNGIVQSTSGGPVQLGGSLIKDTVINSDDNQLTITGTVNAAKFATIGGTSAQFVKGDGSLDDGGAQRPGAYITALTGDGTANGPGSAVFTLKDVNIQTGTYGSGSAVPIITVDSKGRITNVVNTNITYPVQTVTVIGDVYGSGPTDNLITLTLNNVNSNIYSTNSILKFAVNAKGLVTSAAPITGNDVENLLGYIPVPNSRTLTINGQTYDLSANRSWTITSAATAWGSITGTLTNQTDLTTYLSNNYYPLSSNPAGYLTSSSLSGYIPYSLADGTGKDINLGYDSGLNTVTIYAEGGIFFKSDLEANTVSTGYIDLYANTTPINFRGRLFSQTITANRTYQFPDQDGTIALTSDVVTPNLQEVTDVDNITTNDIQATGFYTNIGSSFNGLFLNNQSIELYEPYAKLIIGHTKDLSDSDRIELQLINNTLASPVIKLVDADNNKYNIYRIFPGTDNLTFNLALPNASGTIALTSDIPTSSGTVTSVGLSMPSAFTVSNSPVTTSGTLTVTGAGTASQYIRGDGVLATLPTSGGGGSSVIYYLNGSVNQGTFGGNTYYQMSKTAVTTSPGTDFTIATNGIIARFITDANDPGLLSIPGGNWNMEFYFSSSSSGGSPTFYINVYKYNGGFTLIGTNSTAPEGITNGTTIDSYYTSVTIPTTTLTVTDRIAIEVYVANSGRTITMHTEDNHVSEIITTFSTGLTALNGLTSQVQYFATGTSGSDFGISSATNTHTFNLPTASATNTGKLSSTDWSTFNGKQDQLNGTGFVKASGTTISYDNSTYLPTSSYEWMWSQGFQALGSTIKGINLGLPVFYSVGAAAVLTSGAVRFVPYYLANAATITGVKFYQANTANYTGNNYNGVGLYSYSGGTLTLVASTTNVSSFWVNTINTWVTKAFTTPYSASAGVYYIGMMYSFSAQTTAPQTLAGSTVNAGFATVDFTNSAKIAGVSATGLTSLPSSIAMSSITSTTNVPSIYLY